MKTILGCMAVFIIMIFVFSCSGKESFEKSEDFESGKFNDILFAPGAPGTTVWIMNDPEKVISGKFSAYSKAEPYRGEWWLFLYSDKKKLALERKGSYTVTFKYKAVEAPSADGFYFFAVRTNAGFDKDKSFANDKAFTKWSGNTGDMGNKTISFALGDFDDYFLIWGIHREGALSIDDIKVTKRKKIFEGNEDFESGKFNDTLFTYEGMATRGWIVSDPERVVSGKFSAYGEGNPSKDEWSSFLRSDNEKLALERNGLYTLTFKYKAVKAPSADGYYYFVVWTNAGGAGNKKGLTKWSDAAGTVGTKTIDFTLGDFDDYLLIWGIHREGALSIDDIKVKKRN